MKSEHPSSELKLFGGSVATVAHVSEVADADLLRSHIVTCHKENRPISIFGSRHSWAAPRDPSTWVLINRLTGIRIDEDAREVNVASGETWADLEAELNNFGWSVPVLPSETSVTVGGALMAGGYGERSLNLGPQIASLKGFEVVLADGTQATCSKSENRDLYRAIPATHGRFGILLSARLQIEERQARNLVGVKSFPDLPALVEHLLALLQSGSASLLDGYKGQHYRGKFVATLSSSIADTPHGSRGRNVVAASSDRVFEAHHWTTRGVGNARRFRIGPARVWKDYILPARHALEFARHLDGRLLERTYWESSGRMMILAVRARPNAGRFLFEPHPAGQCDAIGFGVYLDPRDEASAAEAVALHHGLLAASLRLGGHPYLVGSDLGAEELDSPLYRAAMARLPPRLIESTGTLNKQSPLGRYAGSPGAGQA